VAAVDRATAWREWRRAAPLALIAGFVDAYGLLTYATYLSFMSGNTTQTGSQIGQWHVSLALPSLTAIVFFVIGVTVGALLHTARPRSPRLPFSLVAILIGVVLFFVPRLGLQGIVEIAVLSMAMGMLNTTISHIGPQAVNIGFVTGTLNGMGNHLAAALRRDPLPDAQGPWDTHLYRAWLLFGVWAAFFSGALLSGSATMHVGAQVLWAPLVLLVLFAALDGSGPPPRNISAPAA
jgi:uncharacterized membrane protein YoaK (UPF0700 family)